MQYRKRWFEKVEELALCEIYVEFCPNEILFEFLKI